MGGDVVEADALNEVEGGGESGYVDEVGGTGLEFEGEFGECGFFETDVGNHLSPTLIRWHRLKPMLLAVKHTDAGGAIHLMGRECIEIDVEGTDVDVHVGGSLSAVDHYGDTHGMGVGGDFGDGVDCAEDVADMADADETRALVEEGAEGLHVEAAVGEDGDNAQFPI